MKYDLTPGAKLDVLEQVKYYSSKADVRTAQRFRSGVRESVRLLSQMPDIGSPRQIRNGQLAGLRSWPVKDFEHFLIFYVVHGETILIIRILHGRRNIAKILAKEKP